MKEIHTVFRPAASVATSLIEAATPLFTPPAKMSSDPPLFVPPLAPAFTPIVAPPLAQFAVPSAATLAMVPGKDEDAEWFTARDPAGRTYYYHRDGRTSWTAPPSSTPAPSFGGSSTLTPTASASAPTLQGSPVAVVIVSPSAASAESGYVDCCDIGCCGSGSWASITADPERVSWVREERGSCGACCAVCASSQEEAVELRHVVLVEGKSGCVTYVLRFVLGIMLVIGCVVVGLLGNSTGSLLFTAISVSCAVLGVLLLACSCVKESRVHIKTAGDMRPFEAEAVTMMMLPFSSYTRVWDKLRAAWTSHRAARAPLLLLPPPLGDAAPLEWAQRVVGNPLASAVAAAAAATGGAPPAVAGLPVRVPLSPASNLSVSSDGLMEIQGNILCHRESKLAYADAVTWARVPGNCCECCAELQLGVHDDYAAAAMTGANSALVLSALKRTLLRRAPAGVGGGAPASFTAYSQDCFECCCKTTIESDADFVSIRSPCDTVILRTTDVPFVHRCVFAPLHSFLSHRQLSPPPSFAAPSQRSWSARRA